MKHSLLLVAEQIVKLILWAMIILAYVVVAQRS